MKNVFTEFDKYNLFWDGIFNSRRPIDFLLPSLRHDSMLYSVIVKLILHHKIHPSLSHMRMNALFKVQILFNP